MFLDNIQWGNGEYNLTIALAKYWGSMATNKDPGKGNPVLPQEWSSFDKDSENTMVFETARPNSRNCENIGESFLFVPKIAK